MERTIEELERKKDKAATKKTKRAETRKSDVVSIGKGKRRLSYPEYCCQGTEKKSSRRTEKV